MAATGEDYQWRSRRPTREVAKQREVVRLREVEGLSFQEIAERVNYRHRSSAQRAYAAALKAGDLELSDAEYRALLVRRYERMYAIAAKQAEEDQDLGALREAGKFLDKIARLKALDLPSTRQPAPPAGGDRDDDVDGVVIGGNFHLQEMRERRKRDAADRAARR